MSSNYTGLGRYEQLFDQLDVAISRLESRCDKIERRVTNLQASKATYTQQPYACYNPRSYSPQSQSRTRNASYTSGLSSYFSPDTYGPQPYSCSDWDPPGVLSDYYEPPHRRSNSSQYSARQNAYRPPRNTFTSGDQFVEQERPLRQPHCTRQSPNSGWFSPESHQQPFLHAKNQTCWDTPSQTSSRRVGKIRAPPLPELQPQLTPPDQQLQNRIQRPTFPSSRTPTRPQLVLDQKPPLWSDRQLQQPRKTSTIELPPYAAASPCQPMLSLSVKAPLCASPRPPQAGVSSSRNKELEMDSHDGGEKREEKLIVFNKVWNQKETEKENDSNTKREDEVNNNFLRLIEKEINPEPLQSSLETKEQDFSVLAAGKRESIEFRCLVDEHTDGFEIKKQDIQLEMEVKQRLFEDEFKLKSKELGENVGAHALQTLCVYVDLNVIDITSMNPRLPSLDADATILAWNLDNHISRPLLIFYGGDERRRSVVRCVFDPGGDASPKLLLSTLFVASWFSP